MNKSPSPRSLEAFDRTFSMLSLEQGEKWRIKWDKADTMTPEDIMELQDSLQYYKKLVQSYDALINSRPDKIDLINAFPQFFNKTQNEQRK